MDIASISAVVAAVGVIVGVVFTVFELRNLVRTRQTDLTMRLYQYFGTKEFLSSWWQVATTEEEKDYNEYIKKYGGMELLQVSVFCEGLGILLHRKLIGIEVVEDLFSASIKQLWEKYESILKRMHTDKCVWFEHLYNELQNREQSLQHIQQ